MNKKKIIFDISLILVLLTLGLSSYFIIKQLQDPGVYARVTVDGEETGKYPLANDAEYSLNGGTNILVIENGEAYIKYATCPDGLCVNYGRVSLEGESIVCLPNRVMVEIVRE